MSTKSVITTMLVFMALLRPDSPMAFRQNEPNKKSGTAKADDKKKDKKKQTAAPLTVHVKLLVESMTTVPSGSKIEFKGTEEACRTFQTPLTPIGANGITFDNLPRCKVDMNVFITGFATKNKPVDLRESTGRMKVVLKASGDLEFVWLQPGPG